MNYVRQLELAKGLHLAMGQSKRMDCPVCNGKNTFSVVNAAGRLLWNCFKSSCVVHGASEVTLSKATIIETISGIQEAKPIPPWEIPEYFTKISLVKGTQLHNLLETHNMIEAYRCDLVEILRDPKQDRVVFIKMQDNKPIIAIGKAMQSDVKPKWYKYTTNENTPFIINRGSNVGVIVEDVLSAATVALGGFGGICLMGTTYSKSYTAAILKEFTQLVIAFDKDATDKAIDLHKQLSWAMPTRLKMLTLDLKWYKPALIYSVLKPVLS